jgi:hypothetical protein
MKEIMPFAVLLLVLLAGLGVGFCAGRASVDQTGRYYQSQIAGASSLVIDTTTGRQWLRVHSGEDDKVIDMGSPIKPREVSSLLYGRATGEAQ